MGGPARKKTKMKHTKIDDSRLPVTLLSGFLGSGKTTLLQNILQNKQGLKVSCQLGSAPAAQAGTWRRAASARLHAGNSILNPSRAQDSRPCSTRHAALAGREVAAAPSSDIHPPIHACARTNPRTRTRSLETAQAAVT